jgi:hypothetical protein
MTDPTVTFKKGNTNIVARLATDAELEQAADVLERHGRTLASCECGEELCVNGYLWRCAETPEGGCRWFTSDWQCNP